MFEYIIFGEILQKNVHLEYYLIHTQKIRYLLNLGLSIGLSSLCFARMKIYQASFVSHSLSVFLETDDDKQPGYLI